MWITWMKYKIQAITSLWLNWIGTIMIILSSCQWFVLMMINLYQSLWWCQLSFKVINANPDEQRLFEKLMTNYNALYRPVGNFSDKLLIKMGLVLSQIIDIVSLKLNFLFFCREVKFYISSLRNTSLSFLFFLWIFMINERILKTR